LAPVFSSRSTKFKLKLMSKLKQIIAQMSRQRPKWEYLNFHEKICE
jgi:hypothetical protein